MRDTRGEWTVLETWQGTKKPNSKRPFFKTYKAAVEYAAGLDADDRGAASRNA